MLIFSRGVNTCVYIPKMVYLIMDFTVRLLASAYDFIESLPAKMQSKVYIVTSGYVKKRDKTDLEEIHRALRLRAEVVREDE